jgi:hypothetical protein
MAKQPLGSSQGMFTSADAPASETSDKIATRAMGSICLVHRALV